MRFLAPSKGWLLTSYWIGWGGRWWLCAGAQHHCARLGKYPFWDCVNANEENIQSLGEAREMQQRWHNYAVPFKNNAGSQTEKDFGIVPLRHTQPLCGEYTIENRFGWYQERAAVLFLPFFYYIYFFSWKESRRNKLKLNCVELLNTPMRRTMFGIVFPQLQPGQLMSTIVPNLNYFTLFSKWDLIVKLIYLKLVHNCCPQYSN